MPNQSPEPPSTSCTSSAVQEPRQPYLRLASTLGNESALRMLAQVSYAESSKDEKKRLTAEAFRRNPGLRKLRLLAVFVSVFVSSLASGAIGGSLASRRAPFETITAAFVAQWLIALAAALILYAILWESFGRHRLKTAIEKLKNA